MNRTLGWLGLGLIAASVGYAEEAPPVSWATDLNAAREQAKEQGRPLLVVFR